MKIRALAPAVLAIALLPAASPEHRNPARDPNQSPKGLKGSDWSSIRAEYQRNQHLAVPEEGGYRARNLAQQWVTHFDGRGFTVRPHTGQWSWGLQLERYGFAGQERKVTGRARATSEQEKVRYAWGTVEEWFVNDGRGLEHGFTLPRRPARGEYHGPLRMHLGVRGELSAQVTQDGDGVNFVDASGRSVVTYAGLKVWDARGKSVPAQFEPARKGGGFEVTVDEVGAEYPLTIDPIAQQAYLKASNSQAGDLFGGAVAISGDTVVVGAFGEASNATGVNGNGGDNSSPGSGAAYVFVRTGGTWSQQAYLKASNTGAGDTFGLVVAISGDTVVVGAPSEDGPNNSFTDSGAAYVFVRTGVTWSQQAYLRASNTEVSNNPNVDVPQFFGGRVSVSGDTVVVGAPGENGSNNAIDSGAAYVFVRTGVAWSQQAYLKASNARSGDSFGTAVGVSGETVVVGADHEDSGFLDSGAAYVFVRTGVAWSQQAYLKASTPGLADAFGWSVAISGETIVVGAPGEASNASGVDGDQSNNSIGNAGAAYIFVRTGAVWSQQAYLKSSNTIPQTQGGDEFGWSVSISGDSVVVGAVGEDSSAVGLSGKGANSDENAITAGAAYAFGRTTGKWSQVAYLKASNANADDHFGISVAVSGNTVIVGAQNERSNAVGVNGNPNDNSAINSGASYVFTIPQGLFVSKTHSGDFTQGQLGATYTVTVTNAPGAQTTSGTVTVTETVPAGLTLVSMAGSGWNCAGSTCTRGDGLAGGMSYLPITVKVNVNVGAPALVTNQVTVSGGNFPSDTVNDATTINVSCSVTLSSTGASVSEVGGSAAVGVTAAGGCQWSPSSSASWLTVDSQTVSAGNGSFNFTAAANPNGVPRAATISVNDKVFTVTQARAGGSAAAPLRFVPVTPCRIADTRNPAGPFGAPALGTASSRDFEVPASVCGIPASAVAYSLNMTVVPLGGLGFISVWPTGLAQPGVSTLNASDGRVKANAAIVPAGNNGAITVFASHPTQVVIDINGYFVPVTQAQGLAFYPISPCRLADTRNAAGPFGGPGLVTNATRTYPVLQGPCGIPANAQAYATSMTIVPPAPLGFLSTWPAGSFQPVVSTLNASSGTVTSNLAIVPAGTNGGINVFVTQPTHLIIDITGYFAPAGGPGALNFYIATPCRIVDTRNANGPFGGPRLESNQTRSFAVPSSGCGVPTDSKAFSLNATLVPPAPVGFLTLWGSGPLPGISNVNSYDGAIVAVAALTPTGPNGLISAFVTDPTNLLIDINGYFR